MHTVCRKNSARMTSMCCKLRRCQPVDFPYGKAYPASCILAAMTNYTWAGLATDVADCQKHAPGKS